MTNAIIDAIAAHSAHDLARALAEAGVTATRAGRAGSDDESCEVAGYGAIFYHDLEKDPGWVVRDHYKDDCDYPVEPHELASDLQEVIEMTKQIS